MKVIKEHLMALKDNKKSPVGVIFCALR